MFWSSTTCSANALLMRPLNRVVLSGRSYQWPPGLAPYDLGDVRGDQGIGGVGIGPSWIIENAMSELKRLNARYSVSTVLNVYQRSASARWHGAVEGTAACGWLG